MREANLAIVRRFAVAATFMATLFVATLQPTEVATVHAQQHTQRLYPRTAVGSEDWTQDEFVQTNPDGGKSYFNVRDPELTAYLPDSEKANGTAIILLPGGALRMLAVGREAKNMIKLFNSRGIAVFVLKYRILQQTPEPERTVAPTGERPPGPVKFPKLEIRNANANPEPKNEALNTVLKLAIADAQAALRIVRGNAEEWRIDPARIGVIGSSAGGGVAMGTVIANESGAAPDFVGLLYGPSLMDVIVPNDAPPLFMATESNHGPVTDGLLALFSMWKDAGKSTEIHVFEVPNFGMPVSLWGDRFLQWMKEQGFLNADNESP